MPGKGTRIRSIRVADQLWNDAQEKAHRLGETVTDVVVRALDRYVHADDPEPEPDDAEFQQ